MVECHIVALKVMGSSPIIRPDIKSSLGGIGRRDRLKICSQWGVGSSPIVGIFFNLIG